MVENLERRIYSAAQLRGFSWCSPTVCKCCLMPLRSSWISDSSREGSALLFNRTTNDQKETIASQMLVNRQIRSIVHPEI